MKKVLFFAVFGFFLIIIPFPVHAFCDGCPLDYGLTQNHQEEIQGEVKGVNDQTPPNLEELKNKVIQHRETIRERFEEHRASVSAKLAEHRKERIRNFFGMMTKRMEAAIKRLERLISRMESRLAKIEAEDSELDTTAIRKEINEAKDKLAEASAALSTAKTSLEDVLNADNPKTAFANVRDLLKGIKEQLKDVHQILVKVIGEMKGLRVGYFKATPSPKASPLPSASPGE